MNERIIIPMTELGIAYPLKPTSVTPGRSGCACLQFGGASARQIPQLEGVKTRRLLAFNMVTQPAGMVTPQAKMAI